MTEPTVLSSKVKTICESFGGKPFTMGQAARCMVQRFPEVPSHGFSEGWEQLVHEGTIEQSGDARWFRLRAAPPAAREDSQGPFPAC